MKRRREQVLRDVARLVEAGTWSTQDSGMGKIVTEASQVKCHKGMGKGNEMWDPGVHGGWRRDGAVLFANRREGKRKSQKMQRDKDGVFEQCYVWRNRKQQEQLLSLAKPESRAGEDTTRKDCQWVQPSRITKKEQFPMIGNRPGKY